VAISNEGAVKALLAVWDSPVEDHSLSSYVHCFASASELQEVNILLDDG